jgi:DNA-binding response OmpR family regulator
LCIAANLEQNSGVRQELHRKIQLIIRALDPRSQELWTNRLKQALQTQEIRIDFSARNRSVNIQGKILDLSKKKIGLQLLEKLVSKPSLTVDEAIQLLWQSEFSPEHYHRLRMSVHRLNTLIHETAGFGKVVEVDSQNVRLRPEVRLRQASEDGFLRDFAEGL